MNGLKKKQGLIPKSIILWLKRLLQSYITVLPGSNGKSHTLECKDVCPALWYPEDPATGSANGCLADIN